MIATGRCDKSTGQAFKRLCTIRRTLFRESVGYVAIGLLDAHPVEVIVGVGGGAVEDSG